MTNREAIVHMEEIRPKTCKMVDGRLKGGFPDHDSDAGKAIDMAIEALEKQMPKKPNYVPDDDTCVYYHWECPECGNYYGNSIKKGIRALYGNRAAYCSRCGQCLDWEGIDDK